MSLILHHIIWNNEFDVQSNYQSKQMSLNIIISFFGPTIRTNRSYLFYGHSS